MKNKNLNSVSFREVKSVSIIGERDLAKENIYAEICKSFADFYTPGGWKFESPKFDTEVTGPVHNGLCKKVFEIMICYEGPELREDRMERSAGTDKDDATHIYEKFYAEFKARTIENGIAERSRFLKWYWGK